MDVDYNSFIKHKSLVDEQSHIIVKNEDINPMLYSFQKAIVRWALKKGRSAIFADCGLGKTFMQIEFARLTNETALIISPLCVSKQTIDEGARLGVPIFYVRDKSEIRRGQINITNYELTEHFDKAPINTLVCDESSIIKNLAGKTKKKLLNIFGSTKYKLCCTATPCPNDIAEIGNHSELLNQLRYVEMLSTFFINRANTKSGWSLKGHAEEAFYEWMAGWAVALRRPEDIGYDDVSFDLPELNIQYQQVKTTYKRDDELFFMGLRGIQDRIGIRRNTSDERVERVVDVINGSGDQYLIWCGLNIEQDKLENKLEDYVSVRGDQSIEEKQEKIWQFVRGEKKILITKPKIAGFGMNFQNAHNTIFLGLGDSYETYYQCIRRLWRYGQKHNVNVHIVLSDVEREIYDNVLRKEKEMDSMMTALVDKSKKISSKILHDEDINGDTYEIKQYRGDNWTLYHGDCVDVSKTLPTESIDFSVYSPPFMNLYSYSSSFRDMGNSKTEKEFFIHYEFLIHELLRVTKQGRNTAVHVSQVPSNLVKDGVIGLKDFRGKVVSHYVDCGWIYHGEIVIQKNPQVQALRTKTKGLLFVQLKRDSSWLRPGMADYILLFRKPGENKVPVQPDDISNEDWISWAHPVWFNIKETKVLSPREAKGEKDEKHICPLQLDVIDRCIRLWSNKGETVLSPFAGIGSEGHQAILLKRKFIGIELKREYAETAVKNLNRAEVKIKSSLPV